MGPLPDLLCRKGCSFHVTIQSAIPADDPGRPPAITPHRQASKPKNSSWPTKKSAKNTKKGTWKRDALHPPGDRASLPHHSVLFGFSAFSVVKLLCLGRSEERRVGKE